MYESMRVLDAILHKRLLFVTGKGGVGRTGVTLALAVAAVRRERRVLVVEVNPYGRIGEYLGGGTLGAEPREVLSGLFAVGIVPTAIMEEFVVGMLRIRALARRLLESSTFRIVAAAAPGIEDFLTLVKIAELEEERTGLRRRRPAYDLIVVDAPATGHSVPLLATPGNLLKMLPFGPLAGTARRLALLLSDPDRTAVALVTRAEEMAVTETIELASALMQVGVATLPPVVNAMPALRFTRDEARRLRAEPPDLPASLAPLTGVGRFALARQQAAARQTRRLERALATTTLPLPHVPGAPFGYPQIERLAEALAAAAPRRRAS